MVKQAFEDKWRRSVQKRSSLQLYKTHKAIRGHVDRLYDNCRKSGLFSSAQGDRLDTQVPRSYLMNV